jgi:cytochrome oxidase Cu insertion factor (SCO1/SenC/PrrC family)
MRLWSLAIWAFATALTTGAWAQQAPGEAQRPQDQVARGAREFERRAPRVGEAVPDVRLYDASGQPRQLSELRGAYTVLIFGCLT